MTEKQYELYDKKKKELEELENLLKCAGVCYPDENARNMKMSAVVAKNKPVFFRKGFKIFATQVATNNKYEFDIPKPLQVQIAKLIYEYTKQLKTEMENI